MPKKPKAIVASANQILEGVTQVAHIRMRVHQPLPPDHPLNAMIGQVASEWAHLEHILDLIIWELAGVAHPMGACITAQVQSTYAKCKTIIALGGLHRLSKRVIDDTNALMQAAQGTVDKRNRIVHDPWYLEKDTTQAGQFKSMAYKEWKWGIKDIDTTEIDKALASIKRRKAEAGKLRAAILDELSASKKK